MNYKETLAYLYKLLPMYQRVGVTAYKKDLTNIVSLLDFLDNPQTGFRSIHIAGTNGKGTVTHLIAGSLQSRGSAVGVYTSPHYLDFRERIKINGTYIKPEYIKKFVRLVSPVMEEIKPSFFEVTVAMAFHYFKEKNVDWAVIETGLGGRLDSTNIIKPELSVITNIGMDHVAMLGDTMEKIAFEKAGIIKPYTPVVIGEKQSETGHVFEEVALQKNADLFYAEDLVNYRNHSFVSTDGEILIRNLKIDLDGPFLRKNLITALASLEILGKRGLDLDWQRIESFFPILGKETGYMGRWQWLSQNPPILVDSAHNKEGLVPIIEEISRMGYNHIHFILGFSEDKDLKAILPLFPRDASYYFAKANVPRGMNKEELRKRAESFGLKGKAYYSVRKALAAARRRQKNKELIFIGGSIFTIAEVL